MLHVTHMCQNCLQKKFFFFLKNNFLYIFFWLTNPPQSVPHVTFMSHSHRTFHVLPVVMSNKNPTAPMSTYFTFRFSTFSLSCSLSFIWINILMPYTINRNYMSSSFLPLFLLCVCVCVCGGISKISCQLNEGKKIIFWGFKNGISTSE